MLLFANGSCPLMKEIGLLLISVKYADVGIEIYPMDLADADESAYAAMRRSTNGGGENSPHLSWEGEILEALVDEIRRGQRCPLTDKAELKK